MKLRRNYIQTSKKEKPQSSNNHNTNKPNIYVAKLKQEIHRKDRQQEARKTEIMNGVEENGEINEKFKVESSEKNKTESKCQQDLQKIGVIEGKQQQVEETTRRKEYHNISENKINKGMENKMTCNRSHIT